MQEIRLRRIFQFDVRFPSVGNGSLAPHPTSGCSWVLVHICSALSHCVVRGLRVLVQLYMKSGCSACLLYTLYTNRCFVFRFEPPSVPLSRCCPSHFWRNPATLVARVQSHNSHGQSQDTQAGPRVPTVVGHASARQMGDNLCVYFCPALPSRREGQAADTRPLHAHGVR